MFRRIFVSPIVLCRRICAFESGVKVVIGVIAHLGELGAYLSEERRVKSEKSKCKRIAYK